METNETRKGKYNEIILKEKKFQKWRNQIKLINIEEKPYLKKNEVCLLSPNFKLASKSNIYIKVKKKHFIFIIQNNNKNRKHIKIKK
jgi:hypothetical protein